MDKSKKSRKNLWQNIILIISIIGMIVSVCAMYASDIGAYVGDFVLKKQLSEQIEQKNNIQIKLSANQKPVMLSAYKKLYAENKDFIGWLKINDTVINYPVMQNPEDEDYYLSYDFNKNKSINGSLILDNDSAAGVGTKENNYFGGKKPSTNLIIHGHTMKFGQMFGSLNKYQDKDYGKSHSIIKFDSLYERRQYKLMAVFYSKVYYSNQDVFKYYNFFQADNKKEFQYWYENVRKMSLYDTNVTAEFGDEFITLSCCSYQSEDGRFVVVGKRIK